MKLGIGTAQFGLDYGISNQEGKTPPDEVEKILEIAAHKGVRIIDTAPAYGTSEQVLGKILPSQHSFDIVTKTPNFSTVDITKDGVQLLEDTFFQSLDRLNQPSIYGLLIHNADDLIAVNGQQLMEKMLSLKQQRLVKKIGVSVYTADQIDRIINNYSIDLIQLPMNVLDQRLIVSGHLQKLKQFGVEVHARSVFLQGLLLMLPEHLPSYFDIIKDHIKGYYELIFQNGISKVNAALNFVGGLKEIDGVICGVNSCQQLEEIILETRHQSGLTSQAFTRFALTDSSILNPSEWKV